MFVLDTNVISALMRRQPDDAPALHWLESMTTTPVTTVINRAEILAGIANLPAGARRTRLGTGAEAIFAALGVCLPLVPECAGRYADIYAQRQRAGRPIGAMDALIAAICIEGGATLVTRDVRDFDGLGLELVNPWQA